MNACCMAKLAEISPATVPWRPAGANEDRREHDRPRQMSLATTAQSVSRWRIRQCAWGSVNPADRQGQAIGRAEVGTSGVGRSMTGS